MDNDPIGVDEMPAPAQEVDGEEVLFAADSQPLVEPAGLEEGLAPHDRGAGNEAGQAGPRHAVGAWEGTRRHDLADRVRRSSGPSSTRAQIRPTEGWSSSREVALAREPGAHHESSSLNATYGCARMRDPSGPVGGSVP